MTFASLRVQAVRSAIPSDSWALGGIKLSAECEENDDDGDDDEGSSKFLTVDGLTGDIRTLAVLDREVTSSLNIRVVAAPAAADRRPEVTSPRSRCDVVVHVTDENDNSPEFVFPSVDGVNATLFVDAGPVVADGQRLARLDALDRDEGLNANLTYFVHDDDRHLGLDVEPTSGLSCVRDFMLRESRKQDAKLL